MPNQPAPHIIYHDADLDGRGSAAIARCALGPSAGLVPMDYQWPEAPIEAIPDGASVYMLDFSLPPASMRRLALRCPLVWIDHHTPRIRDILEAGPLPTVESVLSDHAPSACLLTWRHFHASAPPPRVVEHIDQWDTSPCRDGEAWQTIVRPIQFALRSHGLAPAHPLWPYLLHDTYPTHKPSVWDEIVRDGQAITRSIDQADHHAVLASSYRVHCHLDATGCCPPTPEYRYLDPGYIITHARVINRLPFDPAILARADQPPEGDELLIAYAYDPTARGWRLSVSPGPSALPTLDAGLLCRKLWDGGGHPGRAGATLPELPAWLLPVKDA